MHLAAELDKQLSFQKVHSLPEGMTPIANIYLIGLFELRQHKNLGCTSSFSFFLNLNQGKLIRINYQSFHKYCGLPYGLSPKQAW